MEVSTRRFVVRQILEWNSIPLIFIGVFTLIGTLVGAPLLGFGIYALYAASRLKRIEFSEWSHAISWAILIEIATVVLMYLCVSESRSLFSITFAILLIQLIAAASVLFLSIGNNRVANEIRH